MSTWLNIQLAEIAAEVSEGGFSEADRAALTCVEAVANQPGMQLTFMQRPGDMLFIDNLAVMHRRDKFFDSANPEERRSLYRMWINLGDGQPVVPAHAALRRGIRGPSPAIASL
jgi:alpha-ketoglutarate-dependent taurine dioxygenase